MGIFNNLFEKKDKVSVQFIDASNDQIIGKTEMAVDQLPATFSVPTTMHIDNKDWSVEQAIPENSEDFAKSGKLVLKMRKIEYVNPQDIWYTIPTIENSFPNLVATAPFGDFSIQIHGDDWLQQELISSNNANEVEQMLEQIRESASESNENGEIISYKNCYVRNFQAEKITDKIYLQDIQKYLEADKVGSLAFVNDYDGFADKCFVIEALGTYFYGQLNDDNSLQTFAIYDIGSVNDSQKLQLFAKNMNLNFVDWVGMYQIQ
ncbi:hypothetical protein [Soonwooa sp.]|uniref:hypothetical protein n=1 Tax=Soonwooa sp. TaxID=1938592 RepID=UPI00260F95A8|nr:hypothetical protein [Soonwooa sp.]